MSDTPNVDDALYQKITDICFENGAVTKPMVDRLYALFTEQLKEAEIRAYQSVMSVAETAEGRRHAYDFCAMKLATLTQDTKGGRDE